MDYGMFIKCIFLAWINGKREFFFLFLVRTSLVKVQKSEINTCCGSLEINGKSSEIYTCRGPELHELSTSVAVNVVRRITEKKSPLLSP